MSSVYRSFKHLYYVQKSENTLTKEGYSPYFPLKKHPIPSNQRSLLDRTAKVYTPQSKLKITIAKDGTIGIRPYPKQMRLKEIFQKSSSQAIYRGAWMETLEEIILNEDRDLGCPISFQLFENPSQLPCTHTFERSILYKLEKNDCPFCRKSFDLSELTSNKALQKQAQEKLQEFSYLVDLEIKKEEDLTTIFNEKIPGKTPIEIFEICQSEFQNTQNVFWLKKLEELESSKAPMYQLMLAKFYAEQNDPCALLYLEKASQSANQLKFILAEYHLRNNNVNQASELLQSLTAQNSLPNQIQKKALKHLIHCKPTFKHYKQYIDLISNDFEKAHVALKAAYELSKVETLENLYELLEESLKYNLSSAHKEKAYSFILSKIKDGKARDSKEPLILEVTRRGFMGLAKWMIEKDHTLLDVQDNNGLSPIHYIAISGDTDKFEWVIKQKPALLSAMDKNGKYPIHYAAKYGHIDLIRWVLGQDTKLLNIEDNHHRKPIDDADSNNQIETVEWMKQQNPECSDDQIHEALKRSFDASDLDYSDYLDYIDEIDNDFAKARVALIAANKFSQTEPIDDLFTLIETSLKHNCSSAHRDAAYSLLLAIIKKRLNCDSERDLIFKISIKGKKMGLVKWMIEKDLSLLDIQYKNVLPFIHVIATSGDVDLFEWMVQQKPDLLKAMLKSERLPIHTAALFGNIDLIRWMLGQDPKLLYPGSEKMLNPIFYPAATKPNSTNSSQRMLDCFKWMVNQNFELLDELDQIGGKPIHYAAKEGGLDIFQWMIAIKPELLDAQNTLGQQPIHYAAKEGRLDVFQWMIAIKPELLDAQDKHGDKPIHYAAKEGRLDLVKWMIAIKPELLDAQNTLGRQPIHYAAEEGRLDLVKWIIATKPELLDAPEAAKCTPLLVACRFGHFEIIQYLVNEKKELLDAQDKYGDKPIHYAAYYGKLDIVQWIIEKKSELINAQDNDGNTPLQIAQKHGNSDIVQFLEQKQSELINAQDKDENAPLQIAQENSRSALQKRSFPDDKTPLKEQNSKRKPVSNTRAAKRARLDGKAEAE